MSDPYSAFRKYTFKVASNRRLLMTGKMIKPPFINTYVCEVEVESVVRSACIYYPIDAKKVDRYENLFNCLRNTTTEYYPKVKDFYLLSSSWKSNSNYFARYKSHTYFWYDQFGRKYKTEIVNS